MRRTEVRVGGYSGSFRLLALAEAVLESHGNGRAISR